MDCIVHGVVNSWTRLSDSHFDFLFFLVLHYLLTERTPTFSELLLYPRFNKLKVQDAHYIFEEIKM